MALYPTQTRGAKMTRIARSSPLNIAYVLAILGLLGVFITFQDDRQYGNSLLVIIMSILSSFFCFLYGKSNWRATSQGRALMYLTLAFSAIILVSGTLAFTRQFFQVPGEHVIRFLFFSIFILTEIRIIHVLYATQVEQRNALETLRRQLEDAMSVEIGDNVTTKSDNSELDG